MHVALTLLFCGKDHDESDKKIRELGRLIEAKEEAIAKLEKTLETEVVDSKKLAANLGTLFSD